MMDACSSPTNNTLPSLLETTTGLLECQSHGTMQLQSLHHQNPFLVHQQENDLKSLINPIVSQSHIFSTINGFQPSFSPTPTTITPTTNKNTDTNNPSYSPSMLFKSLLSHQDLSLKEQATIPKQCKTEANFSHFQLPDANFNWVDKIHHQNPYHNNNPLFFEMDSSALGFSGGGGAAAIADTSVHEMSTSVAFNRAGFQMLLDTPIRFHGESWPLDP